MKSAHPVSAKSFQSEDCAGLTDQPAMTRCAVAPWQDCRHSKRRPAGQLFGSGDSDGAENFNAAL